jgi:hypothetical protein
MDYGLKSGIYGSIVTLNDAENGLSEFHNGLVTLSFYEVFTMEISIYQKEKTFQKATHKICDTQARFCSIIGERGMF